MVIVDVDIHARFADQIPECADPGRFPDVDQDQPGHLLQVDLAELLHLHRVQRRLEEEPLYRLLLRARKHQDGLGVKLAGRQHRGNGVEVRVDVGGDNFHT